MSNLSSVMEEVFLYIIRNGSIPREVDPKTLRVLNHTSRAARPAPGESVTIIGHSVDEKEYYIEDEILMNEAGAVSVFYLNARGETVVSSMQGSVGSIAADAANLSSKSLTI